MLVANLAPGLDRREPPDGVEPLLARFPEGLTTQEVAALLVRGNDAARPEGAEVALVAAVGAGRATRSAARRRRPLAPAPEPQTIARSTPPSTRTAAPVVADAWSEAR